MLVRLCRSRPNGCGGMNGKSSGGGSYIERVMEAVMTKFQPGTTAHYYIITTLKVEMRNYISCLLNHGSSFKPI